MEINSHFVEGSALIICEESYLNSSSTYRNLLGEYFHDGKRDDLDLLILNKSSGRVRHFQARPKNFLHLGYYLETNDMEMLQFIFEVFQAVWSPQQIQSYLNHMNPLGLTLAFYPLVYNRENRDNAEMVELLCRWGMDFNILTEISQKGLPAPNPFPPGISPLFVAVQTGSLKVARQIMACGGRLDYVNPYTNESLSHVAAQLGDWDFWKDLIERGVSVHVTNSKGETPLRYAYRGLVNYKSPRDHGKIIEDIKKKGVAQNLISPDQKEIFEVAAEAFANEIRSEETATLRESPELRNQLFSEISISGQVQDRVVREATRLGLEVCERSGYSKCEVVRGSPQFLGLDDEWGRLEKEDNNSRKTILLRKIRVQLKVEGSN